MNASAPRLIAVVGGSGAGKGWLAGRLCAWLGESAAHLPVDSFYRDRTDLTAPERDQLNFDAPEAIDWDEVVRALTDLRAGREAGFPRYDFASHRRLPAPAIIPPRPVVFVEGLWLLQPPAVRALFDLRIYLDAPEELRSARRRQRDLAERGRTAEEVEARLRADVLPAHAHFVEPQRAWADLVLGQPYADDEVARLAEEIGRLLAATGAAPADPTAFRAGMRQILLMP